MRNIRSFFARAVFELRARGRFRARGAGTAVDRAATVSLYELKSGTYHIMRSPDANDGGLPQVVVQSHAIVVRQRHREAVLELPVKKVQVVRVEKQ